MKKTITLILVLLAAINVSCQEDVVQERLITIEERIMQNLCNTVNEGEPCNMPPEWSGKLKGMCCDGKCRIRQESCEDTTSRFSIIPFLLTNTCRDTENGERCALPPLAEKYGLWGTCCERKCECFKNSCYYEDETENKNPQEMPAFNDDLEKAELEIVDIQIYPEDLSHTLQIEHVELNIQNIGNVDAKDIFWVTLNKGDDSTPLTYEINERLPRESNTIIAFENITYKEQGVYLLSALVDKHPQSIKDNQIDEIDENNNKISWRIIIGDAIDEETQDKESLCGNNACDRNEENTCPEDCADSSDTENPPYHLILIPLPVFLN